jgi:MFS family permease
MLSWVSLDMVNTTIASYSMFLNATAGIAGFISGSYFVLSFLTRPFSGYLGNRLDRKKLLFVVSSIWTFLILLMALLPNIYAIWILRALQGILYSIVSTLQMTIAADVLPQDRIGEGIGYFGLCQVLAQMIGPSIALSLVDVMGYQFMYFFSFILRIISAVSVLALPSYDSVLKDLSSQRKKFSLQDVAAKESLIFASVGMLFAVLNSCLTAFLALYAKEYNIGSAGYFFMINAVVSFITRTIFSKWSDSRTIASTAFFSGLCLIAAMLLLGLGRNQIYMMIAGISFGFGYGMLLPVTQSKSVKAPPVERRNSGSNTYYLGIDTGFAVGNFIGGNVAQAVGFANMYLWLIIPACMSIGLALWKGRGTAGRVETAA